MRGNGAAQATCGGRYAPCKSSPHQKYLHEQLAVRRLPDALENKIYLFAKHKKKCHFLSDCSLKDVG